MPILYILPAIQTTVTKPAIIHNIDKPNCQAGTPNGSRTIITIGEVSGIILNQKLILPLGEEVTTLCATTNENTNGMVMGNINCCVSVSLSTAEPTAANKAP